MIAPRLAILALLFFSDYLHRAYESGCWLCGGFLFVPTATIAYAWGKNTYGAVEGPALVLVIVAVLFDFGLIGGGAHQARSGWEDD